MEALLEKEGNVENWNDDRLDELSRRVDNGFQEMREGFARVDAKIDRLGSRVDKLFYIQFAFMASLALGVLTGKI
jgi:ribosome assembly protein YihI (activator of Der GTPase)